MRRKRSPGLAARGRAVGPLKPAGEARRRGCRKWRRTQTQWWKEERVTDAGPGRTGGSVLVLPGGLGPEAVVGAESVAS